jgi:hypothetical protein
MSSENSAVSEAKTETKTAASGRYVLEHIVGRGGMATVYRALDEVSGRHVALKLLTASEHAESAARSRELFEREYHTLMQLAHPRIVSAIDYGLDGELPYYTMELLDGGDLLERSPLPWQKACSVARDVCAALALVHSRRLVYRDLSPRNVRCTIDGKAKLIDFGAMAPMGPAPIAVCTPCVASPEVVHRLPLDGRSDLYALGATLYFTLSGHNAYPARTFSQLTELWREPPPLLSSVAADIPPALEALVMELLQLDPQLRPTNAAEVGERLSAIAGLEADEQLQNAQAYLTTPTLAGRDRELRRIGALLTRFTQSAQGAALLVRGAAGMGRTRVLEAAVVSAKLAGLTAIHATAASVASGPNAIARAIVSQLLDAAADDVLLAALPRDVSLEALRSESSVPQQVATTPAALLLRNQVALRTFVLEITARCPLLVAVDDFQRLDAESRALVTLLAHESSRHPMLVIATSGLDRGSETDAARLLAGAWSELALKPLDVAQTRALLVSIFGDVPNMVVLVRRLHALAAGNPRDLMLLAQHLLDRGIVRYVGGAWVLPESVDGATLPETMAQAFRAAVLALSEESRTLGRAFALCPDQRFSADECLALLEHGEKSSAFRSLDQLLAASVIALHKDGYALAAKEWIEPLVSELDAGLEQRLANVFTLRGDGLRAARHLFRAGQRAQGVDVLVAFARRSHQETSASTEAYVQLLSTLPEQWMEILQTGITVCEELGRSAQERYAIQLRMGGLISQTDTASDGQQAAFAKAQGRDAGLDIFASLDAALPPGERVRQALGAAAARYQQTPEHDRVLDPKSAIGALARTMITAIGSFSRTLDVEEWRRMPDLAPFAPLSPAVAVVDRLARGFQARVSGRFEAACEIYRDLLTLMASSGGGGLDPAFVESMQGALPGIVGMMEAALGLPSSERWADETEAFPLYHGSALSIRMLYRLWLGDIEGADTLARQRELWRLEQPRQQASDVLTPLWTFQAHAASDDLTRTRQNLAVIERTASKLASWKPIAAWARGEYERIRGDHAAALTALDAALEQLRVGEHQIWPFAAAARVRVLCDAGRFAEARQAGEAYVAAAEAQALGYVINYIRMPLALAAAKLGDADAAWHHARLAIEHFEGLGARGLNLGLAYEAAARVASCLEDAAALERYSALCKECFLAQPNPALAAKYQRLGHAGRVQRRARNGHAVSPNEIVSSIARSQIESMLMTCGSSEQRVQLALQLLVSNAGAESGHLYTIIDGTLAIRAGTGGQGLPSEVEDEALRYLQSELGVDGDHTADAADDSSLESEWTSLSGRSYRPVLLGHLTERGFVTSGLAVLAFDGAGAPRPIDEIARQLSRAMVAGGDLPPLLNAT